MYKIAKDLFVDGFQKIGLIAPLASLLFTICKLLDVKLSWLQSIDYAWGLLPLLIWVTIAYVRRWQAYNNLVGEYDHCLFLEHIQINKFESPNNVDENGEPKIEGYCLGLTLRNTSDRPVKYEIENLNISDFVPTAYDNKGAVISPQSQSIFFSPRIDSNTIPEEILIKMELAYGSPMQPKIRMGHKKIKVSSVYPTKFTYIEDTDNPYEQS